MKAAPLPSSEEEKAIEEKRLQELDSYDILDTEEEKIFDDITNVAASICETKICLISLIDEKRQWFKSRHGLDAAETPRDISFCGHAIEKNGLFLVEDAQEDKRFCDNPLFLGEPHVRFYAGVPLVTSNGYKLGTLCVIDSESKKLSEYQIVALESLAKQVISYFEIRRKNKELVRTKEHFEEVQAISKTGHWQLDLSTNKVNWSKEVYKIYGVEDNYPIDKIDAISFYAPEERERVSGLLSLIVKNKKPYSEDFRFIDANGVNKWVRSRGQASTDDNGNVIRLFGTFQDITELKESEKTQELVLENISEGYWDCNLKENTEYISPRFWEILGHCYEEGKETYQKWKETFHPQDYKESVKKLEDHIVSKGVIPFALNARHMHADKYWSWIRTEGKVIEWDADGKAVRIVGTHRDIHEDKIKEEVESLILGMQKEYIEKKNELRDFFSEILKKLVSSTNSSGGIVVGLYGKSETYAREQLKESDDFYYDLVSNNNNNNNNNNNKSEDHSVYCLYENIYIILESAFQFSHKEESKIFDRYFDALREIVFNLKLRETVEKQRASTYHNAKLASLGELAAGVGHEINNPMTIIQGQSYKINKIMNAEKVDVEKIKNSLDSINLAIVRVTNIVSGLKKFSRRDTGEQENLNLTALVEETISMIKDIYLQENISIFQNLCEEVFIKGNKGRIEQVLINLLSNAKDALETTFNKEIKVSLEISFERVKLTVADNGEGMSKDLLNNIFDPFFTSKGRSEGTGIGLSLCHQIITEHSGEIFVKSKPCEGTAFELFIPTIEKVENLNIQEKEPIKSGHIGKVLLVEDEEDIRDFIGEVLEEIGLTVSFASNGVEAFELYLENHYDLIVSDVQMPRMNGDELLKKVRGSNSAKQPKFILMTGGVNIDIENSENKIFKMTDGVILKPFDGDQIKEKIDLILLKATS